MHGYQLTFYTQQDRRHKGRSVAQWIIEEVRNMGIRGATMIPAAEGFGHDRKLRSVNFFELTDQPLKITMAVSEPEVEQIFARLNEENINIFFVKTPIEFGMTGEGPGCRAG